MITKQAYFSRVERIQKAIALEEADRVPFMPKTGAFIATACGLSQYDLMKDIRNLIPCLKEFLQRFPLDSVWPAGGYLIDPCDLLGARYIRLPGPTHGLPLNSGFQMLDGTYMEDDEFDEFLLDPTHFMLTKVMPRKYKMLEPFSKLCFREIYEMPALMKSAILVQPDVKAAMEALMQAGQLCARHIQHRQEVDACIRSMGFPCWSTTILAPFDVYADSLRGLIQAVMDIKDYPDEVLAVTQRIEQINSDQAIAAAKARGENFVFIPLHAGGDEFMSQTDYATFYWPGLKRLIEKIVAAGLTPYVFCEGKYNTRLEFLKDVPKGKVIYMFEQVDIVKAKKALADTACICGNLSTSLLLCGTQAEVRDETKRLLDLCAPGGGFIMDCSVIMDVGKIENFEAWYETTMTYGVY